MNKAIIDTAVEYWANFFVEAQPRQDSLVNSFFSYEEKYPSKEEKPIQSEKIGTFKGCLEDLINKELSKNEILRLSTGWLPEVLLNDLLLANNLPLSCLPIKTTMIISKEKCIVFANGHEVVLYPN